MAEEKIKNQVSAPPLQVGLIDKNGLINRSWSIWFRSLYNRVGYKGGNAIDENLSSIDSLITSVQDNIAAINENKTNISVNGQAIVQNALAIAENATNIAVNVQSIVFLANSLDNHVNATVAHNSNGNIVGFNDLADETTVGLVKQMQTVNNATNTSVNIATADIGKAPATYNQSYAQSVADIANESKQAINQIAIDLNDTISIINDILEKSKNSGQMKV